ncbi:MAG: SGNH/GDSL hydrolase family protein [Geitlerinemataceae cyanobacterium]
MTQNAILSLVSIFLTFIFLEVGARFYLFHLASKEEFTTYASLRQLDKYSGEVGKSPTISHHRYIGYYATPNYQDGLNRHNSLGYRGEEIVQPKPKEEFRILCIGASTTYTTRVKDYRLAYPYLLEQELHKQGYTHVKVVNAGVPGWDTWNMSIDFELRGLDLNPDMIIFYEAFNDVKPRLVWPPEAYKGDNSGRNAPMISRVSMPNILEYSTLFRILGIVLNLTEPHTAYETIDRTQETYVGGKFHDQLKKKSYPSGFFEKVSVMDILKANPPKYYQRNIENIVKIAKARNIKVLLANFVSNPLPELGDRTSTPEYIYALEEHNQTLKSIAQQEQVNLFDLASTFPKDPQFFDDGIHVNAKGSLVKANLFAQYLVDRQMIPKSGKQLEPQKP